MGRQAELNPFHEFASAMILIYGKILQLLGPQQIQKAEDAACRPRSLTLGAELVANRLVMLRWPGNLSVSTGSFTLQLMEPVELPLCGSRLYPARVPYSRDSTFVVGLYPTDAGSPILLLAAGNLKYSTSITRQDCRH